MDTSLLVNGRKDGKRWVIITIPDDPKDEGVIDCGYHTLADALEVVADMEEFREAAAQQREAAAQKKGGNHLVATELTPRCYTNVPAAASASKLTANSSA